MITKRRAGNGTPSPNGRPLNPQRIKRDIIVIGGSAGSLELLLRLFQELPASLPAAVAVVLHRSPFGAGHMEAVLDRRSTMRVQDARDGMAFRHGCIYLAPSDYHMTLEDGHIVLNHGPKENSTRPSVDPLFRSAAAVYGRRVASLLLTGGGDDGVNGMLAIKEARGLNLVQDPTESLVPYMPMNALRYDHVDRVLATKSIASVLLELANGRAVK